MLSLFFFTRLTRSVYNLNISTHDIITAVFGMCQNNESCGTQIPKFYFKKKFLQEINMKTPTSA